MKYDLLKEFAALRANLEKERQSLQERLDAINAVLGGKTVDMEKAIADLGGKKKHGRPKGAVKVGKVKKAGRRGPRKMSDEAKARIAAAARERWAKIRAQKTGAANTQQSAPVAQPAPSPAPQS